MAESATLAPRATLDEPEAGELAAAFEDRAPEELLRWAIDHFGDRLAIATSFQAEGMAIVDMAWRIDPRVRVVTVDSGRLHQETFDLIDRVRERYNIPVEVHHPDAAVLDRFIRQEGANPFYQSTALRLRCCQIRKVDPLTRALTDLDAWVTGRRRDQTITRRTLPKVELDRAHGGRIKLNPLADWSDERVWAYLRANSVPHNALYDRGYTSIGCAPCTRPTAPGADPRSGRWWWEGDAPKECGLHCRISLPDIHTHATGGF